MPKARRYKPYSKRKAYKRKPTQKARFRLSGKPIAASPIDLGIVLESMGLRLMRRKVP